MKTINYTTKMGMTAKKSEKFNGTVLEAKAHALANMNGDTYTVTVIDEANKMAFHYGHTGVSCGSNRI